MRPRKMSDPGVPTEHLDQQGPQRRARHGAATFILPPKARACLAYLPLADVGRNTCRSARALESPASAGTCRTPGSCTAVSGTDTPAASTRPHRPHGRNSGKQNSMQTRHGIDATDTTCSRPAGESRPSGNAPCVSRLRWRLRSTWNAGCAEAPSSSTRVHPCRICSLQAVHHDDGGPKGTLRTVFHRPQEPTSHSRPEGRALSPDGLHQPDHAARNDTACPRRDES